MRWALASLFATNALISCNTQGADEPAGPTSPGEAPATIGDYDARSVIVRFKPVNGRASLRATQAAAMAKIGATFVDRDGDGIYDRFANIDRSGGLVKLDLPVTATVEEALAELRRDPSVAYAEPNYIIRSTALPDDPSFSALYNLHNTGQTGGTADADIDAPEAWELSTGSHDVVVGVLDTGIDSLHPDLAANLWRNPGEIPDNNVDDDGNGVIDDFHGLHVIDMAGEPFDDDGHGTHCAGVIGAAGDNGVGVAGVNWNVSIMALKSLWGGGIGITSDAIAAIDYAIGMRAAGVNLRVLASSWGGTFAAEGLEDAIEAAAAADILFVAAAGNGRNGQPGGDNDAVPFYPASYPTANIIAVAATGASDELAAFSNFGASSVDLGAPGVAVMSTVPRGYAAKSGTSMAAPHVAGAAALLLSIDESLTAAELKQLLLTTGDALPSLAGKTASGRRLNVASALAAVGAVGSPAPHFTLGSAVHRLEVNQGAAASFPVELSAIGGFGGEVGLTVTSQPAIAAALSFSPQSITAPGASTLTVTTSLATVPGFYTLTLTGTAGERTRSRTVGLLVRPFGTVELTAASTDTPAEIPNVDLTGLDSVIRVEQQLDVQYVKVTLDVTVLYASAMRATLTSPGGTTVVLHERSDGAIAPDIHRSYLLPTELFDQQAQGDWVLHIDDDRQFLPGTLESWTLSVVGVPSAPTFAFVPLLGELNLSQARSTSAAIDLTARRGFSGNVALSVSSSPPLAGQLAITPSLSGPGGATLSVSTTRDTAPGIYQLTILARSGAITKTTPVQLVVSPFGHEVIRYASTHAPRGIPDEYSPGLTSALVIGERFTIERLTVEVHITHPRIMDLVVELLSPDGTAVVLHERAGRLTNDLHRTYEVPHFVGRSIQGAWKLRVRDEIFIFTGTLDRWVLRATGASPATGSGSTEKEIPHAH
jgi:serine protease